MHSELIRLAEQGVKHVGGVHVVKSPETLILWSMWNQP